MRFLILGVSALSLGACTMGGVGYGSGHSGHEANSPAGYGSWQGGYASDYGQAGEYGYAQTSCAAPTAPHAQGYNCGTPTYAPPVAPCYQPIQTPCAAAQPQPINYGYPATPPAFYPNGYPAHPVPTPAQPVAPSCGYTPCANTYAVSPYAYDGEYHSGSFGAQAPAPHAYGTQSGSSALGHYGHQQAPRARSGHFYGTVGAVWYDVDQPYAGVQGRLGYQATSILGAEIEGSIGVISEVSPFNETIGGIVVSGEFKDGVDYSAAAFATARLPISRNISTHARVGYHSTRTFADVDFDSDPDQETTTTLDGLAYGAGIQLDVTPVDAVRFDFTRYSDDAQDNDAVSVAYLRRF